jgi:hypothetical protein
MALGMGAKKQEAASPQQKQGGRYSGLSSVKGQAKRVYLPKGRHKLEVIMLSDGNLPKELGGAFFFGADFKVLESSNPDLVPGSERSWMVQESRKFPEYFLRDVKNFLAALTKQKPEEIEDEDPEFATSQDNPMRGFTVYAETVEQDNVNPKTGEKYLRTKFSAAE